MKSNLIHDAILWVNGYLWTPWTFFLLMGAGILFTIWTRFCQWRVLTHGVQATRGVYDDPDDPGAINHFQALSAALSATVGLGNIGGVAIAIGLGGPGALFWMWIIGLLGMALKTIEITLAMIYRNTDDPDNPHGGAMWVIDKALGAKGGFWVPLGKTLGSFFCVTCVISAFTGGNMFQVYSVAELTEFYFDVPKVATGIILCVGVGLVIVGGIKRIGNVAGRLVPVMCIMYLLAGFVVLANHAAEIPGLLALVVRSALSPTEATGAFLGCSAWYAFSVGLRRALFSNEAGQGSSPIAHSAAKTDEPVREGIVGGMEPFIDTICICTLTALVILSTGTWNRDPVGQLNGTIEFVQVNSAENTPDPQVQVWQVNAPTSAEHLPQMEGRRPWSHNDKFFVFARVIDNTRAGDGSNVVRVDGLVGNTQPHGNPGGAGALTLKWADVAIDADEWEKPVAGIEVVDGSVFRSFDDAKLTAHAFDREYAGLGKWLVTLSAWLFAYSTMISWSYYGEQSVIFVLGQRGVLPYKIVYLALIVIAPTWITNTSELENLMDLGTGCMIWANMPIVLLMGVVAVRAIDDYFRRLDAGEFHPHAPPPITEVVSGEDVE